MAAIRQEAARFDAALPALRTEVERVRAKLAATARPMDVAERVDAMLARLRGYAMHWTQGTKQAWSDGLFGTGSIRRTPDLGIFLHPPAGRVVALGMLGVYRPLG